MSEVITLSSEDEEKADVSTPPKKRAKLVTPPTQASKSSSDVPCIVLDDDEDEKKSRDEKTTRDEKKTRDEKEAGPSKEAVSGTSNCVCGVSEDEQANEDIETEFKSFLSKCVEAVKNAETRTKMERKIDIVKHIFAKLKQITDNFKEESSEFIKEFKKDLQKRQKKIKATPDQAVLCFCDTFQYLKLIYKEKSRKQKASLPASDHKERLIDKLDRTLTKLRKRIHALEQQEIDWDDEENSTFMQLSRYQQRAAQIYAKMCKLREESEYQGCLLFCRLDFSASKYTEINRAINKKYKNNSVFPTFYDMDKLVRKAVQQHQLALTEADLSYETTRCFEELGKLLQRRRQRDLYDTQRSYIEGTLDPALEHKEIEEQLASNRSIAKKNEETVIAKYVEMQEKGVNPEVSSESDDSNVGESDSGEENKNVTANTS